MKVSIYCFLSILFAGFSLSGQNYNLLFRTGAMLPEENLEAYITKAQSVRKTESFEGKYYRLIQFYEIPSGENKKLLKALGITLLDYMPHKAYFASIQEGFNNARLRNFNVRSIIEIIPEYKLAPELLAKNYPSWAVDAQAQTIDLNIICFADAGMEPALSTLINQGAKIIGRNDFSKVIAIRIPVEKIEKIVSLPFVAFAEPVDPPSEPENLLGRTLHRSNAIAVDYSSGRKYDGTGVKIALGDDGIIGPHIDYQGRTTQTNVNSNNGYHGDHVAGIIFGAGNLNPDRKGMAYGADIRVYNVWDAVNFTPSSYYSAGIRITSTSYSNGCNAGYTSFARTVDQQMRSMPSLLHVFSAGNSGELDCGYGAGEKWGNVTGGVKIGKNVLTVGSVDYLDVLASSSSRGPAHDGRIKPEVCAQGVSVLSTIDTNTYTTLSGTSMSCPAVSGSAAQLYSAYKMLNGGNDPLSCLIKAALMNSADDLGNAGPDFRFGFGRINDLRAAKTLEQKNYIIDSITDGDLKSHQVQVPSNTKRLKIMIYWNDYEASVNSGKALVNDLDLTVADPARLLFEPWVLNSAPDAITLNAPATRGSDKLNNMEQVTVDDPASGLYTINVSGFEVPQGPQTYAIVYEFINEDIVITHPTGGESFVPKEYQMIRWDAYGVSGTFNLDYSEDMGATWKNIITNLAAERNYYYWKVPDILTGQALVRIERNGITGISDTTFSIIGVPANLKIEWSCVSSFNLKWDTVIGATAYEVSMLGQKYMDSVNVTSLDNYTFTGIDSSQTYWVSVKALVPGQKITGKRAIAISKNPGALNCSSTIISFTSFNTCNNLNNGYAYADIANGTPPHTFYWSPGGQTTSAIFNLSAGTYTVSVTDANGFIDTASVVIINNFVTVKASSPITICAGDTAYLTANATSNSPFGYIWMPGGSLDDSTKQNPIAFPLITTTYTVVAESLFRCTDTSITVLNVNTPPAVPIISWNGSNITSTSATGNQWYFNDSLITGAVQQTLSPTALGVYKVIVTDTNGCMAASQPFQFTTVNEINGENNLQIFPNPAAQSFTVKWNAEDLNQANVVITDVTGREIFKAQLLNQSEIKVDISAFAKGIYLVQLNKGEERQRARIVFE